MIFEYPTGRFVSKIHAVGSDPGSYSSISAFDVDTDNQKIYILDGNKKRLLTYLFDGRYLESKELPFFTHNFSLSNNSFVFFNYSVSDDKSLDYQIMLTDVDMNIKEKAVPIDKHTSISIKQINRMSNYTNESVLLLPKDNPYAYEIKNNKIHPKYFFNFKKNWNPQFFYADNESPIGLLNILKKNEIIYGLGAIEGDDFMEIDFWLIDKHFVSVYNKKTAELTYVEQIKKIDFFPIGYYNGFFISINYLQDLSQESTNETVMI